MKKLIVSLMLIAMSAFAAESAPSSTVGYVKFDLVVGSNFVSLPVPDPAFSTASNFYAETGNRVNAVYRYLPATQTWNGATRNLFGVWTNNFAVASGQAYLVGIPTTSTAGSVVLDGSVVTNPAYDLVVGSNVVHVPLSKASMTTASTYYAETGNRVNAVYRWLPATQVWNGATRNLFGVWTNNYTIGIAEPHQIGIPTTSSAVTWPTGGGKIEAENSSDEIIAPKSNPKQVSVGFLHRDNREFTALETTNLTFKAWLTQGAGPAVSTEILNQVSTDCYVTHYGDIRGTVSVAMQNYNLWALNNVLNILAKDENDGLKVYYEALYTWTIDDASVAPADLGFEDYFGFGGFPMLINNPSSIEDGVLPAETKLHQNYPNPFNPTTTIKFDLAKESVVKLNVYNYNGQLVRSLVDGQMNAGYHSVNFDASSLSAGVYYYTMETAGMTKTQKMVLVK